jgi:hypothetical protein
LAGRNVARLERTLGSATRFLDEMRAEIGRAAPEGETVPPRLRCVHERPGHATPEYRTLAIPVPEGLAGSSPEILSGAIARFAAEKTPTVLLLALDLTLDTGSGPGPVLVAEARDAVGTRLFWMQPYRLQGEAVAWDEPLEGGWKDPGEEEMILDAAFRARPAAPAASRGGAARRRRAPDDRADGRGDARGGASAGTVPLGMAADGGREGPGALEAPGGARRQE